MLAGLSWLLVHHGLALSSGRTLRMRGVHRLRDLSLLPSLLLDAADDTDDDDDRDDEADRSQSPPEPNQVRNVVIVIVGGDVVVGARATIAMG